MKNKTIKQSGDPFPPELCDGGLAQFHRGLSVLTGKWKGEILWQLVQLKQLFGELRRSIPGVTQHMLTMQLRDLEADGLVKRTIYPEVPPRVEYEITPSAKALKPVFDELLRWSQEHDFPTGAEPGASPVDEKDQLQPPR
jgi:DNA-binding HxlR family transcriptional regulator